MIHYNFPYRGSFEYDRWVLNAMQFHNITRHYKSLLKQEKNKLKKIVNENEKTQELVDRMYMETVSTF